MSELRLILYSQLQFYRRHPLISLMFLLGLCLGTALISAITHLNTEAGQRYQTASDQSASPVHFLIKPVAGTRFLPAEMWFTLRQQGIVQSQPVLTGQVQLHDGRSVLIRGVNSLALLSTNATTNSPPNTSRSSAAHFNLQAGNATPILIASELAERLAVTELRFKGTEQNRTEPQTYRFTTQPGIGPWLIMDISLAHHLLQQQGWIAPDTQPISLIELGELSEAQLQKIRTLIGNRAVLSDVSQQSFDALSESFFFNLTALALLGYAVGLFLSLNALRLMLSARQRMQQQMVTLGCLPQRLQQALALEMLLLCTICAALGNSLGYWIAQGLIHDVTTTLVSLYRLDRALTVHWQWQSFAVGFGMNLAALAAMMWHTQQLQPNIASKKHHLQQSLKRLSLLVLLVTGAGIYYSANNKYEALLLCGWLIILFAVSTLPTLRRLSTLLHRRALTHSSNNSPKNSNQPLTLWLKANTHKHLQDVSLAVLAFLIALGAAIGTQVMVRSFALTLDTYLQQRLQADLYLRSSDPQQQFDAPRAQALAALPQVQFVSTMETAEAQVFATPSLHKDHTLIPRGHSALVISYGDKAPHFQHLSRTDGQAIQLSQVTAGNCLANEPTALRYGWQLGDYLPINQGTQQLSCRISGFYYDYGTQRINLVMSRQSLQQSGFRSQFIGYALMLTANAATEQLLPQLMTQFNYSEDNIVQNAIFKRIAKTLFSSTFAITDVLNTLIVSIALIAIWVSFLSMNQQQQNQFGIVQALGVTPRQLFWGQLSVTASLLLLTLLLALPLGISLGHVLLKFVMPISFGWSMPMIVDWANIAKLCVIILVIAFTVTGLSIWRLQKQPIANLIKEKL